MAAIVAFASGTRRSSKLLEKLLRAPPRDRAPPAAASASRSFSTSADVRDVSLGDERGADVESPGERTVSRRRERDPFSSFFSDVMNPIFPGRSLSQVLNLMDQLAENPLSAASRGMGMLGGARRGWDVREDEDALYLRIDMPGLGKEQVKVSVDQNTLLIRGEGEKEEDEAEESGARYSSRMDLPPHVYKLNEIKAEMKNGVLKVVVPKAREADRGGVTQIQVD